MCRSARKKFFQESDSKSKVDLFWLAVQPTPYNHFFYSKLLESELINFSFVYSDFQIQNLPFDISQITFSDDRVLNKTFLVDFCILLKAFKRDRLFMVVGWNDPTKVILMLIRAAIRAPYFFWTDSIDLKNLRRQGSIIRFVKSQLLNRASVVFTTGQFGVSKMIDSELVKDPSRLRSMPFFVPNSKNPKPRSVVEGDETLVLLQSARLIRGKGLLDSIAAIAILKKSGHKVELRIAGTGPEESSLKASIASHGLQDSVVLLGWVNQTELGRLREQAHALVHTPEEHDPFPLVVLEGMAAGLPIVGTLNAGSVADRVVDGMNGVIVEPGNPQSIALGVERLLEPGALSRMSLASYDTALKWPPAMGLSILEQNCLAPKQTRYSKVD
jgi:glycosyltransferase involved in cell wall biosynthesis